MDKAALRENYRNKSDDELLELFLLDTLLDVAYEALEEELNTRGIEVPARPKPGLISEPSEVGEKESAEVNDGSDLQRKPARWGAIATGFGASSTAILTIMFGKIEDDPIVSVGVFTVVCIIFAMAVDDRIDKIVAEGYFERSWGVSLLSTVSGISTALIIFLIATAVLGERLLADDFGFLDRLTWALPALVLPGVAYLAPIYLKASHAKKNTAEKH